MFLPFTPTELQVSSSCNKINQPLKKKKQTKKTPCCGSFTQWSKEKMGVDEGEGGQGSSPPAWPSSTEERKPMGKRVRLQLRSIEETEANHTV